MYLMLWLRFFFLVLAEVGLSNSAEKFAELQTAQGSGQDLNKKSDRFGPLVERQIRDLHAEREAVVWYRCPIGGARTKIFKWVAHFRAETSLLSLTGLQNIDSWDHIDLVTNDFLSTWHHHECRGASQFCCVYTYQGTIIGTLFDDRIEMGVITPQIDYQERIKVTELCMRITGNLICPQQVCPVSDVYHHGCNVEGTVVTRA